MLAQPSGGAPSRATANDSLFSFALQHPLRYLWGLAADVYIFTSTLFFAAVNASKWIPYAWLGLIDLTNMTTAAALAPVAPVGVWLGVRFVRRVPQEAFYKLFHASMLVTGAKLLWDGLR